MNIKNECISLYREAFSDDDSSFEKALFENCFKFVKYLEKDGQVVSMFFLLPCKINSQDAFYLFAAATKEEFKNQGLMSELINKNIGKTPIFLRPADNGLIKFYEKFGFKSFKAANSLNKENSLIPAKNFKELNTFAQADNSEFTLMAVNFESESLINFAYSHF